MKSSQLHPIRVVSGRTNLSQHVIRVWERRYNAVIPGRSPTKRRRYSEEDIERLILLRRATENGYSIGGIADLPVKKLRELAEAGPSRSPAPIAARRGDGSSPDDHLLRCLDAVRGLDAARLAEALERAAAGCSRPVLLDQVVVPLMHRVGELWQEGAIRVSHEHLASSLVRTVLGNCITERASTEAGPEMIVTTPPGQMHELGALTAATVAFSRGFNVTYLGPNLPVADIAAAVAERRARFLVLSLVYPPDDPRLAPELERLGRLIPPETVTIAGGRAAARYGPALAALGAVLIEDMTSFSARLDELRGARGTA